MARRGNILDNVRNPRNSGLTRNNPRNRTRNRNSLPARNNNNRRNSARRVFRPRTNKGGPVGLNRRGGGNNPKNESSQTENQNRRGRFRRNRRSFTYRRFNSSYRSKQNFKRNKDAKTADQMDMELDVYMGGEAAKARMDADLTRYFTQPEQGADKQ